MFMSQVNISFFKEINTFVNNLVKVNMDYDDKWFVGTLIGLEQNSLSLVLIDAKDESNNRYEKIVIRGNVWTTMTLEDPPFPIQELAERVKKVLPNEAVYVSPEGKIELLEGRIVVSEHGVEGSGATAQRIQKIWEQFVADRKSGQ